MRMSASARRQQTLVEIDRLSDEFRLWECDSYTQQYETQLAAIRSEVLGAAKIIRTEIDNLSIAGDPGALYGRCAAIEKQITWLWRVWYYFRAKVDQRKDARFAATLEAADEVVWSCYRPFFKAAATEKVPEPAPLPYIETEYSPLALRRDQPGVLGGKTAEFDLVADAFASLPVPILKLPIATVTNPWMLVLIGHETGHFIQPLIAANDQFVKTFRLAIEGAVDPADARDWGGWSIEIFADWYSILTMGPWALWAMAQFEQADSATLTRRRGVYPSPLVRLELMAQLSDRYGLAGSAALAELGVTVPAGGPEYLARDRAAIPKVVHAVCALPECEALRKQVGLDPADFAPGGQVAQWSTYLAGKGALPEIQKPRSARRAAAGAAAAWDALVLGNDGAADPQDLRVRSLGAMKRAAPPGVRSSLAAAERAGVPPGQTLRDRLARAALDEAEA